MAKPTKVTVHFNDTALTTKTFQAPDPNFTGQFFPLEIESDDYLLIRSYSDELQGWIAIAGFPKANILFWESDLVTVA